MDIQVYNCIFFFNLLLFAKRGLLTEEICLNRYLAFLLQENHSTLMQSMLWSSRGRLPITPCDQIIAEQVYCNWRWQKEISWADELFFCWVENLCRQILWPTMPQSWQCGEDSFSSPRNGCETPPWPQLLAHCLVGTAVLQDVFWSLPSVTTLKVGWICSTYLFTIIQTVLPFMKTADDEPLITKLLNGEPASLVSTIQWSHLLWICSGEARWSPYSCWVCLIKELAASFGQVIKQTAWARIPDLIVHTTHVY